MPSELFSDSTRTKLLTTYKNRCAICLMELPQSGGYCAHILDAASFGKIQLDTGVDLGFIEERYMRSSEVNGMVQCPTCHLAFFTPRHIVLSPAKEVLLWYKNYLLATLHTNRKPLYEIHSMLSEGRFDGLPDVKPMLPFVSLFSVIVVKPIKEDRHRILTCSQPNLSILGPDGFDFAPPGTSPGDPNVARIFDVIALPSSPIPVALGQIPLSPSNPEFAQRRLWRLPIAFPVTLTAFFSFIVNVWKSDVEEIRLALDIRVLLLLQMSKLDLSLPGPSDGSGNPGDSSNDKDEHDGWSAKRSFDQFNTDKLAEEQASKRMGGVNDDDDLSLNRMKVAEDADEFNFSEHSISSSNDGGPESWRFGPSFTTHRNVFETCGYMLPLSVYNRKPMTS